VLSRSDGGQQPGLDQDTLKCDAGWPRHYYIPDYPFRYDDNRPLEKNVLSSGPQRRTVPGGRTSPSSPRITSPSRSLVARLVRCLFCFPCRRQTRAMRDRTNRRVKKRPFRAKPNDVSSSPRDAFQVFGARVPMLFDAADCSTTHGDRRDHFLFVIERNQLD